MASTLLPVILLTLATCASGQYASSSLCQKPPPHRTIPIRLEQFAAETTFYHHAMANANRVKYESKCMVGRLVRSPYNKYQATLYLSQEHVRTGAVTTSTVLVTEHCPGIWEFREERNRGNYNINYKLWGDGQSLIDLKRVYQNGEFYDDVYVLVSTRRYLTRADIEMTYRKANVQIRSLVTISMENCRRDSYPNFARY